MEEREARRIEGRVEVRASMELTQAAQREVGEGDPALEEARRRIEACQAGCDCQKG